MEKTNKILIVTVLLLAVGLAAESAYVFRHLKRTDHASGLRSKFAKHHPMAGEPRRQMSAIPSDPFGVFGNADLNSNVDSWNPFEEMEKIQGRMNRMFRESMGRAMSGFDSSAMDQGRFFEPDIDVQSYGNNYVIRLDLPGMEKDKINVTVNDHTLVINGERKVEKEQGEPGKFYRVERSFGNFERAIPLPKDADTEKVNAEYQNGVLTITLSKISSAAQGKQSESKIAVS